MPRTSYWRDFLPTGVHGGYPVAVCSPHLSREAFPAAVAGAIGPACVGSPGEHMRPKGHRCRLAMGIMASLHCEPSPVVLHD